MSSRNNILKRLRQAQKPFNDVSERKERLHVKPMSENQDEWKHMFIERLHALSATVHQVSDDEGAIEVILDIVGDDLQILAWDFEHIPVQGLELALDNKQVKIADHTDATVRVGITGVDAALVATGSLIVTASGKKPRHVSLLPYVHVAIVRTNQLVPHLEAWMDEQRENPQAFRDMGNVNIITGASRTADIGMELVLGAHGPADLQVILID